MPIVATDAGWVWRFLLVDATDDETAETGLSATATATVCAVGATTFSSPAGSISELQRGWYEVSITSAELGTEDGEAICEAYDSGTDIFREKIQITDGLPANVKTSDVKTGYSLSTSGVNAIRNMVIEGDVTLRQAIALLVDIDSAKSSGGGEKTQSYRNRADTLNRVAFSNIQVTTGNRLATGVLDFDDLE